MSGQPGALARTPAAFAVAGALTIAFSSILVKLAAVSPATAAVFRCAYAVPLLWLLARREGGPRRSRAVALATGVLFALDLVFWHQAIDDVGAGLATVLGNSQVLFVGALAWALLGERPEARLLAAAPLVLLGVVLISGALEDGAYGDHPGRGVVFGILTGLSYAGFILVLRHAGGEGAAGPAGPLLDATIVAAVVSALLGLAVGDVDLAPSWPAHGWLALLAVSSQVLGWMLISTSLPRLPAALSSVLLTLQPVGSVALGVVLLGEEPTALQIAGVALVLLGVVSLALRRRRPRPLAA